MVMGWEKYVFKRCKMIQTWSQAGLQSSDESEESLSRCMYGWSTNIQGSHRRACHAHAEMHQALVKHGENG
jgi:hypothetical protein